MMGEIGMCTPKESMTLVEKVALLRKQVWKWEKENRRLKEGNKFCRRQCFFRRQSSGVSKVHRIRFVALKTEDGVLQGKQPLVLPDAGDGREGFYKYLTNRDRSRKYQTLAKAMLEILEEGASNFT